MIVTPYSTDRKCDCQSHPHFYNQLTNLPLTFIITSISLLRAPLNTKVAAKKQRNIPQGGSIQLSSQGTFFPFYLVISL